MQIKITSTTKIVELNGVPARIWEGETSSGVPVHCFVTRIAVADNEDCSQFDKELQEHEPPSPAAAAYDARLVL